MILVHGKKSRIIAKNMNWAKAAGNYYNTYSANGAYSSKQLYHKLVEDNMNSSIVTDWRTMSKDLIEYLNKINEK